MMSNFSTKQRLHLLFALLLGDLDERIRFEINCFILFSLRIQISLLSSVEFPVFCVSE